MRYPIPTKCKQRSCSCTALSSSPSVLVWLHGSAKQMPSFQGQLVCGAGNPCQQGSSAQAKMRTKCVASLHNRGFSRITCQARSCQSTPYGTQVPRVGRSHSRPHTHRLPQLALEGKGTHPRISSFFSCSLRKFISIVSLFLFVLAFSSPLSNSENPLCLPPPAPTANPPPGVLKKPQLQTYLCLRN
jgi:hypothetical protein